MRFLSFAECTHADLSRARTRGPRLLASSGFALSSRSRLQAPSALAGNDPPGGALRSCAMHSSAPSQRTYRRVGNPCAQGEAKSDEAATCARGTHGTPAARAVPEQRAAAALGVSGCAKACCLTMVRPSGAWTAPLRCHRPHRVPATGVSHPADAAPREGGSSRSSLPERRVAQPPHRLQSSRIGDPAPFRLTSGSKRRDRRRPASMLRTTRPA